MCLRSRPIIIVMPWGSVEDLLRWWSRLPPIIDVGKLHNQLSQTARNPTMVSELVESLETETVPGILSEVIKLAKMVQSRPTSACTAMFEECEDISPSLQ